jgi:hypothetical protein
MVIGGRPGISMMFTPGGGGGGASGAGGGGGGLNGSSYVGSL